MKKWFSVGPVHVGKREVTILSCGVRPGISAGYGVRLKKVEKVSCDQQI